MVTLIEEADPRARGVPEWVVGLALEPDEIVVFPGRILSYPYDSIESVFRHEVAHLALSARAGGQPMPRWFHEGLAVSVDAGWGVTGRLRLLLEMTGNPGTADLARLFASDTQAASALAYGLSAALVADVQRRHGRGAPGAIAARMADGVPFARAFQLETDVTPDAAASRAWAGIASGRCGCRSRRARRRSGASFWPSPSSHSSRGHADAPVGGSSGTMRKPSTGSGTDEESPPTMA